MGAGGLAMVISGSALWMKGCWDALAAQDRGVCSPLAVGGQDRAKTVGYRVRS